MADLLQRIAEGISDMIEHSLDPIGHPDSMHVRECRDCVVSRANEIEFTVVDRRVHEEKEVSPTIRKYAPVKLTLDKFDAVEAHSFIRKLLSSNGLKSLPKIHRPALPATRSTSNEDASESIAR